MDVWAEFERKLAEMPDFHPTKQKLLKRVHFFGQANTLDRQGRLVIPSQLRESARMSGNVDVLGMQNRLDVWNHDVLAGQIEDEPFLQDMYARCLPHYEALAAHKLEPITARSRWRRSSSPDCVSDAVCASR